MVTLEEVRAWDSKDPLGQYRNQFVIDDPDVSYLVGNSLGRLPKDSITAAQDFLTKEWGAKVVSGWYDWINESQKTGDLIGRAALGAAADQVVCVDNTSVNFYQLCKAAIDASPGRRTVITDTENFPTDRYVLEGICEGAGLKLVMINDEAGQEFITPQVLQEHLNDDVALVTFSVVQFRSGALHDVPALTRLSPTAGAKVVWDASHAVGVVPLNFDRDDIDGAVGCTYKYGNSGPGAPAWLYVNKRCQEQWRVPIQGWFAQEDMFKMGPKFKRASGMTGYRIASPSIVGLRFVQQSFQMIEAAGIANIYQKANRGTDLMLELFDQWLAPLGFGVTTPRAANERGGHLALTHPRASEIVREGIKQKVMADFRNPDSIRVAFSPLTTSYEEAFVGLSRIREIAADLLEQV